MFISVVVFSIFVVTFAELVDELLEKEIHHFDQIIIQWIHSFRPDLTPAMKFFTFFGSIDALSLFLFISSVLMIWKRKHWEAVFLIVGIGAGGIFNLLLKWIFQRQRPTFHRLIEETGFSFPSGHSMGSFIFYGMLCMVVIVFLESKPVKVSIILITIFLIFMIGFSRIYLGVHFPSDVLAGYAAGGAWLTICLMGLRIILETRGKNRSYHSYWKKW
jgi:undecaprenyl-diphosphatase